MPETTLTPLSSPTMLPAVNPAVIFKPMSDGAVLFDPGVEIYFGLNEVGARVWELLPPASQTFDELCGKLSAQYPDVPEQTIRQDVRELLDELVKNGLARYPASSEQAASAQTARAS